MEARTGVPVTYKDEVVGTADITEDGHALVRLNKECSEEALGYAQYLGFSIDGSDLEGKSKDDLPCPVCNSSGDEDCKTFDGQPRHRHNSRETRNREAREG